MAIIKVQNLFKKFKIPHERRDSIRENFFNLFKRRTYEEFFAIDDLNIEVKEGEFIGVIGRNGSGKSTLLKILAGVYFASEGLVEVNGNVVPFLELGVGFNPELTGRENVFLNASILGMSEIEIESIYEEIVEFAELSRFMDQKLKNYSSGMQVRLAFSIAMKVEGDIYLMDEVLAVGDADFQVKCFEKFKELKRAGKTIIFVSHDLDSIRRFCDRVLYLRFGKNLMFDYTDKVLDKYIYEDKKDDLKKIFVPECDDSMSKSSCLSENVGEICLVKNVYFESENGEKTENFVSGDEMFINVEYERLKDVDDIVLGIAIYKDDDFIYGTNSYLQGVDFDLDSRGVLKIFTDKLNLLRGTYYLTVAFHSKNGENYHWLDKAYSFNVLSRSIDAGFVDLNFKIDV